MSEQPPTEAAPTEDETQSIYAGQRANSMRMIWIRSVSRHVTGGYGLNRRVGWLGEAGVKPFARSPRRARASGLKNLVLVAALRRAAPGVMRWEAKTSPWADARPPTHTHHSPPRDHRRRTTTGGGSPQGGLGAGGPLPSIAVADALLDERRELTEWAQTSCWERLAHRGRAGEDAAVDT
jgi:hypothetical protein